MTNAQRQAKLRIAREAAGLKQCNIWVPAGAIPELQRVAELLRANPDLTVGRMVNTKTGRVSGLK